MQNPGNIAYRLSPQQRRIRSLHQAFSGAPFMVRGKLMIDGSPDLNKLGAAIETVAGGYEIFFELPETVSRTVIVDGLRAAACEIDLGSVDGLDLVSRTLLAPSETGPLLRVDAVTLSPEKHMLLFFTSSLCADGVSMKTLLTQVIRCYAGEEAESSPIQYADLAEWQNDLLDSEETEIGRRFWMSRQPLQPSGRPAIEEENFGGGFSLRNLELELPASVLGAIENRIATRGAALRDFLLVCWRVVLFRRLGRSGAAVAFDGRRSEEVAEAIGPLTKYISLSAEITEQTNFSAALDAVAHNAGEAAKWQEYFDYERLEAESGGGLSIPPFGFAYHQLTPPVAAGGCRFSIQQIHATLERFAVHLLCERKADRLTLSLDYDPVRVHENEAGRLLGSMKALLENACAGFDSPVYALESVTPEERKKLLVEWNRTERVYPRERGIHHLFEEQARRRPEQIAVRSGDEQIRYESLNAQANQLARRLRAAGVENETPVAICLPRGVQMIVALLAVMKSGGCYVPVDLNLPLERQSYLLEDAGVKVILSRSDCEDRLAPSWSTVILLDEESQQIALLETSNLELEIDSESLAYILYTSGSTGRPKGVMIPHRGVVNYLCWSREAYRAEEGRGSIVHSPLGFDLTVTSLLTPLVSGQCVWLASEEESIEGLGRELARGEDFTLLKLTPSHLEMLRWGAGEGVKGKTRTLVIGGEELREESLKFWRERAPGTRLMNEYGPTETVVGCSVHDATEEGAESGATPIGRPIWNARMYVLGPQQEPSGIGVEGEIYIGGEVVGRGYVGKGDQTAERFVPDPYSPVAGARMYRSGDQGRVREDGVMEYLGRRDGQVKLRGHRIELGEIEEQLRKIPGVAEAAAAIKGEGGEKRLVGYVVEGGREVSERELKESVERTLPSYMRPSAYVKLAKLPLTLNGKVDRGALPQWEQSEEKKAEDVEPRTPAERELAEIWIELLGLKRVSVHDNFFELGGHSLLATQVVSAIREQFQIETPLAWFFSGEPTVARLAEFIENHQIEQAGDAEIAAALEELGGLNDEQIQALLAAAS